LRLVFKTARPRRSVLGRSSLNVNVIEGAAMRMLPALILLSAASASAGPPDRSHLASVSVETLKLAYMECDRGATSALLGSAEAANCSQIHEDLKERAFGGDYGRLLAWWHAERNRKDAAR